MKTPFEKDPCTFQQGSERVLIERSLLGDQGAFESLMSRYRSSLFSFVRRRCADDGFVEDIVQIVFLQFYLPLPRLSQHLSSTQGEMPLRAWLFRVAASRCIDEGRRRRPLRFSEVRISNFRMGEAQEEIALEESLIDLSPRPEEVAEWHDLQEALRTAIDALPGKFRSIVLLRYTEELTFQEIAYRLQMREGTVRTYFRRARLLLCTSLTVCARDEIADQVDRAS